MSVNDLVLVQGMKDTRLALTRWNREPAGVLLPWLRLSVLIALGLLFSIWLIALLSRPDLTVFDIPGYNSPAGLDDYLHVLYRNSLVLALHALACVAGFIAGSSLPLAAAQRSGLSRWVHEKAGPLAIGFVVCATLFSLTHAGVHHRRHRVLDRRPARRRARARCCSRSRRTRCRS